MEGGCTGKGWVPGQSGNPGGRPKGRSITALLREILDRPAEDGGTIAEAIAQILIDAARNRGEVNIKAVRELLDRTEGRPRPIEPDRPATEARTAWDEIEGELDGGDSDRGWGGPAGAGAAPG